MFLHTCWYDEVLDLPCQQLLCEFFMSNKGIDRNAWEDCNLQMRQSMPLVVMPVCKGWIDLLAQSCHAFISKG